MDYKSTKRLRITPIAEEKFRAGIYEKLEKNRFPPPEIDLVTDITFFGNAPQTGAKLGYDQFFSYTKTLPLYDQRKERENRGSMSDKWRNIHQQEAPPKPVPATTSAWYGRRPNTLDPDRVSFGKMDMIGTFFARQGALRDQPIVKYTEATQDLRL